MLLRKQQFPAMKVLYQNTARRHKSLHTRDCSIPLGEIYKGRLCAEQQYLAGEQNHDHASSLVMTRITTRGPDAIPLQKNNCHKPV